MATATRTASLKRRDPVDGSQHHALGLAEGLDHEFDDGPATSTLLFRVPLGLDLRVDRHSEKVQVWVTLPLTRKPFCVRNTVYSA
jgi:hypothetical protein